MKPKFQKQQEAEQRQSEHNTLTPEQKLAKLDAGGYSAKKERAKLQAQIDKPTSRKAKRRKNKKS